MDHKERKALVQRLGDLWLEKMKVKLVDDTITAQEMSTLARVLENAGWDLDMHEEVPLAEKLTRKIDPETELSPEEAE